jgi:hypothetical protein
MCPLLLSDIFLKMKWTQHAPSKLKMVSTDEKEIFIACFTHGSRPCVFEVSESALNQLKLKTWSNKITVTSRIWSSTKISVLAFICHTKENVKLCDHFKCFDNRKNRYYSEVDLRFYDLLDFRSKCID